MLNVRPLAFALCLCTILGALPAAAQVPPHRSYERLVSSNGHGVVSYDVSARRIDTFLEHAYRFATPRNPDAQDLCFAADESRDLAFDTYFGIRVQQGTAASVGTWLPDLPLVTAKTEVGTGIIGVEHLADAANHGADLEVTVQAFMPIDAEQAAVVQVLTVRNLEDVDVTVTPYALFNFHMGDAAGGREPSSAGEQVAFDPPRATFYEYSDQSQGTIAYTGLTDLGPTTVSSGPQSAYNALLAGADLDGSTVTNGPTTDVAPGMQGNARLLAPGEVTTWAVLVTWALDEDAAPKVDAVRAHLGAPPDAAIFVEDERTRWEAWHAEGAAPPASLTPEEEAFFLHNAAMLRMGQVDEAGAPDGQILASLPPGLGNVDAQWNISWVRDMAYATAGLAHAGHLDEAWRALEFQLTAPQGLHTDAVGRPYRISITRYFGDGTEESDCNADGPNIEFDGFGLFLWSLAEYHRQGGDLERIRPYWPVIRDEIVDVIISLQQADGLLAADSSIWEVHQNGNERRFAFTSMAAARGLCDAAALASALGEDDDASRYQLAGERTRDAIGTLLVDDNGALGQSLEDVQAGQNYADAAAVEAVNWGLVAPEGPIADATFALLFDALSVPSGNGLMRNDDGGDYDSQEWVFIDLRVAAALKAAGRDAEAQALLQWVQDQAFFNDLQVAELFDRDTADYRGSIPMIGFGAGAWFLAATAPASGPACGAYFDESIPDAGPVVDAGPVGDAGIDVDAGADEDAGAVDAGDVDDAGPTEFDGGRPTDAGAGEDGGAMDAGDVDDAGISPPEDAGNGDDAGAIVDDGGTPSGEDAGSVTLEPAPTPEGEPEDVQDESCSCETSSSQSPVGAIALVLLGLFAGLRRRRVTR